MGGATGGRSMAPPMLASKLQPICRITTDQGLVQDTSSASLSVNTIALKRLQSIPTVSKSSQHDRVGLVLYLDS